jgi:hypothetical protein
MKRISGSSLHLLWSILLPVLSTGLVLVALMRRLIFSPGYIIYRDLFPGQLHYPTLWHPQGSFMALENYKFVTFTGLFLPLMRWGLDVYEKGVYISAMAIAFLVFYFVSYQLLGRIRGAELSRYIKHFASGLAALIYVANPAAANIFFDFSLFVGYAFAPLTLLLYMEMLERRAGWQFYAVGIAGLWWLSAIKAHWIVFGALLFLPPLSIWMIWHWQNLRLKGVTRNLIATVTIVIFYLSLSAYWLIPFIYASGERFVGSYAPITVEAVTFLSYASLWDTMRLLGNFQAWPYVQYESPHWILSLPWTLASMVVPALALAGLVWFRRHWQVWTFMGFAIIGILLTKGFAPPLDGLYQWLVFGELTPPNFRWLFRVSSKWNVFLSLGYSGLAAFALSELASRTKGFRWRRPTVERQAVTALLALIGTILAFPFFAWPSFSGDFGGALVPVSLPSAIYSANEWLVDQEQDFKVNWMPVTNGRELTWNPRPSGAVYTSLSVRPSIHTNWNRHPMLYYSYIYDTLTRGQTVNFGKLLSPLNTRYMAFHDDILTPHIHAGIEPVVVLIEGGEQEWAERFTQQQDMRLAWQQDFITIYETADYAQPVFVPEKVYLTTGDLTLFTSLSTLDNFRPSQNAILFDTSRSKGTFPLEVDGLLLKRDAANHLNFALLPIERLISPAEFTISGNIDRAWSRFDIYQSDWQFAIRDYGIVQWAFDYGQGMVAYASPLGGNGVMDDPILEVPVLIAQSEKYHVWVRALRHLNAGELHISIDGQPFSSFDNNSPITGFVWLDAGVIELEAGNHLLGFQNQRGFAAVNALALVSQSELEELQIGRQELAERIPNIYLLEAESDFDIREAEPARDTATLSGGQAVVVKPGTSISSTIDLVLSGEYTIALRAAIPDAETTITISLGETQLSFIDETGSADLNWFTDGEVTLEAGSLPIQIETSKDVAIDAVIIYTNSQSTSPESLFTVPAPIAEVAYEKLDPTRYRVRLRTESPVVLALAETFDPLWVASMPGFQAASIPLYGVINGFIIDQPGTYDLILQFEPQQWARLGSLLTALAVIAVVPFLLITGRNKISKN